MSNQEVYIKAFNAACGNYEFILAAKLWIHLGNFKDIKKNITTSSLERYMTYLIALDTVNQDVYYNDKISQIRRELNNREE